MTMEELMKSVLDGWFWKCLPSGAIHKAKVPFDYLPSYASMGATEKIRATLKRRWNSKEWTEDEKTRLIELRSQRLAWRHIAVQMKRPECTIVSVYVSACQERGVEPDLEKVQTPKRIGQKVTQEAVNQIVSLRRGGKTFAAIADELNIHPETAGDAYRRWARGEAA